MGATGTASFDGSANATIAATVPNNSITAAKLGTNEQKQICKAWVNFNGVFAPNSGLSYSRTGTTVTVTSATHGLQTGWTVAINPATDTGLTGFALVTVTGTNTFTFQTASTGASTGTLGWAMGIRSSYNVSSISKFGSGDYGINFATPMADANYSVAGNVGAGVGESATFAAYAWAIGNNTTTAQRIVVRAGVAVDPAFVTVQIFGN